MKSLSFFVLLTLLTLPLSALAADGTSEGAVPNDLIISPAPKTPMGQTDDVYVLSPFESVSISQTSVWQDNRHRAYFSTSTGNVNGFLLFDVTQIPDSAQISALTLRCYLENAFGSPANNPVVDVYYSGDDNWTRMSATPGSLSLDVLLADNIPFSSYVTYYDFVLDASAHDWSQDLLDNRICLGFKDDVSYYSYVYFFGAYGSPVGPAPQLTIVTGLPNVSISMLPVNPPIIIPAGGGSFGFNVTMTNNGTSSVAFQAWIMVTLPSGASWGPALGPVSLTLAGGGSITRLRTQTVPGAAPAGTYTYIGYVGLYPNSVADSSFFAFQKTALDQGGADPGEWTNTGQPFEAEEAAALAQPSAFNLRPCHPNPFNPSAVLSFELPEASPVKLIVYDISGRLVAELANGWRQAGLHEATLDGSNLASGIYVARLDAGSFHAAQKLVLLK